MERIIKSGVIGFKGANAANHTPYLSKAKQRDLMCEEDTWKVSGKDGRSDFGSFTSNKMKILEERASQTKHYKCGSFHHPLPSISQKVQLTLGVSRILQWMGEKKTGGKEIFLKEIGLGVR